ncbi:MAG: hypothetical protein M1834_006220 [Cirrosporium novae-zelandiae]|nr:MAG: hypothetical protein M1834_006220 [Cirrosporium novae-zelandiae]
MSRQSRLPPLNLDHLINKESENNAPQLITGVPTSPLSPVAKHSQSMDETRALASTLRYDGVTSPTSQFTSLPPVPASPKAQGKDSRENKKGIWSNFKASRSQTRLSESPLRPSPTTPFPSFSPAEEAPVSPIDRPFTAHATHHNHDPTFGNHTSGDGPALSKQRSRGKFRLLRTQSFLGEASGRKQIPKTPTVKMTPAEQENGNEQYSIRHGHHNSHSHHGGEHLFGSSLGSSIRNRSADSQQHEGHGHMMKKDRSHSGSMTNLSASFRERTGGQLLSNLRNSGSKAADGLGKAGRGIFGKMKRSGSSNDRETYNDDNYICTVINLPLIEQTRRTRIAKRIDCSRDKTEFWMPALPWRCIDYLNAKGCEEEGLYRIPGSGKEVKHWQRRFDIEHDIDLFEEPDLYDINIIGSMFKAWLRELPDELFPKGVQKRIADSCIGATTATQVFKDELSKLPPYNYYLLFAITCHLSQLHACVEKNKMNYNNLCICFQPCLKIDLFCFRILVTDWKNCWQGCWTEKQWLEEELRIERLGSSAGNSISAISDTLIEEHVGSSSENITPASSVKIRTPEKPRPSPLPLHIQKESNNLQTPANDLGGHGHASSELPPLMPLSPMAPIKF